MPGLESSDSSFGIPLPPQNYTRRQANTEDDDIRLARALAETAMLKVELGDLGSAKLLALEAREVIASDERLAELDSEDDETSAVTDDAVAAMGIVGVALASVGFNDQALKVLESAAELDGGEPGSARSVTQAIAHNALGVVKERMGLATDALEHYSSAERILVGFAVSAPAVAQSSLLAAIVNNAGVALGAIGDHRGASEKFEKAVSLANDGASARERASIKLNLGLSQHATGNENGAKTIIESVIDELEAKPVRDAADELELTVAKVNRSIIEYKSAVIEPEITKAAERDPILAAIIDQREAARLDVEGRHEEAKGLYQKAVNRLRTIAETSVVVPLKNILESLGNTAQVLDNFADAQRATVVIRRQVKKRRQKKRPILARIKLQSTRAVRGGEVRIREARDGVQTGSVIIEMKRSVPAVNLSIAMPERHRGGSKPWAVRIVEPVRSEGKCKARVGNDGRLIVNLSDLSSPNIERYVLAFEREA